ncbi:MAG TPA: glycosyltransferase family 39 protein [Pyrinomonadaceae bacterium]|nr:glycosyltransferase family 39 protein [Pyrinomonadaceae bacterium]
MTSILTPKRLTAALLIVLAVTILFGRLGSKAVFFDEAIYAEVSKQMVERGEWLTSHWNGRVWFEKPPAYFWATALLFKIFGVTEFWARFASALSGLGVLLLAFLIARRIYNQTAGILAVLILLSTQLFVYYARFGSTDTMLTLFIVLAVYSYLRTEEDERFWVLAGASCAMALMVKGAAGLIAPAVLLVASLIDRRFRAILRSRWLWLGIAVAVLIAAPWHLLMYRQHGDAFVNSYLSAHVISRAKTNINEFNRGYGFYFSVLKDFVSPWAFIFPFALIFARRPRSFVVIVLAAMVFVGYTLVQTKFQWYILPAIPPFAIVTGGFLARLAEQRSRMQLALGALALILLWGFAELGVLNLIRRVNPEIESAARLAKLSSDSRGIIVYPEYLEMTVKFYSESKLCTDPVINKLSHKGNSECEPTEATHMILRTADRPTVETRFTIDPLREDGPLTYASIARR